MVDVEAMKRNYSKQDFVWTLENLFLLTGWSIIEIHYLHSMLIAALLICLRNIFQFSWSRNPVIVDDQCDTIESRQCTITVLSCGGFSDFVIGDR